MLIREVVFIRQIKVILNYFYSRNEQALLEMKNIWKVLCSTWHFDELCSFFFCNILKFINVTYNEI